MIYHLMWFFIAAALPSHGPFPFWESEKSIHMLTELLQSKDGWWQRCGCVVSSEANLFYLGHCYVKLFVDTNDDSHHIQAFL